MTFKTPNEVEKIADACIALFGSKTLVIFLYVCKYVFFYTYVFMLFFYCATL